MRVTSRVPTFVITSGFGEGLSSTTTGFASTLGGEHRQDQGPVDGTSVLRTPDPARSAVSPRPPDQRGTRLTLTRRDLLKAGFTTAAVGATGAPLAAFGVEEPKDWRWDRGDSAIRNRRSHAA